MKTGNLLKIKVIISFFIILGVFINVYTSILVLPVEFGVIILFLTIPSSIVLLFLLFYIFSQKSVDKFSTILFSLFVGLIIPVLFSIVVYRDLKVVLNIEKRQWRNFHKRGVAPIKNGKWFYPNEENPWQILNFKKGKQDGEQILYLSGDKLNKEIEYFTNGKLDSIFYYSKGKLVQNRYGFDSTGNNELTRTYIYEKNELVKVINFFRSNYKSDTILIEK